MTQPSSDHVHPPTPASPGRGVLGELAPLGRELRALIPTVYENFGGLHTAALADGALSKKTKELIALAIGISSHCDGCIASHARGASIAGATEQEVAEVIGVTILMNGGPATIYGPRAFAAFKEFVK
ncbi:MAG: carboxymuconolactone decarboxylase family protein [Ilumatobacteraceae bacterium]|nr:carboxymuconolactone decarboxylase family protein [Ilumatobacteraceae bacterium]